MRQALVHRSVARATGESLGRIRRIGFVLLRPFPPCQQAQSTDRVQENGHLQESIGGEASPRTTRQENVP